MKMFKLLFLIILLIYTDESSGVFDNVYDTGKQVWKLFSMMDELKLDTPADLTRVNELFSGSNREMIDQINSIHKQFLHMEKSMNRKELQNLLKLLPFCALLFKFIDEFDIFISGIDENYERFTKDINGSMYSSNEDLQDFVHRFSPNIEDKIVMIRKVVTGGENYLLNDNLIFAIANYGTTRGGQLCDNPQIISSLLVRAFEVTMIAEMKVQVMLASTNIFRYPLNGDVSFYEMEEMSQATIFRYHWTHCRRTSCNDIMRENSPRCDPTAYDIRSGCSGISDECADLSSIKACVLREGPHRFQYVNSTKLGSLGRNFECSKDNGYIIEDGKGWDYVYGTCACNCYKSHNKISLAIVESNVQVNKVITGLRFVRKGRILYIQSKEGTLDVDCYIKRNSERWISLPTKIDKSQIHSIDRENRVFFLDELRLPFGFILTGVKFNKVTRENVTGFSIEIFGAPFDYKSGKLNLDPKFRTSIRASNQTLGERLIFEAKSSVHTNLSHLPSSERMKYVSLERSNLPDDFGQSTLPLFDAVPIKTHPPTALGGVEIFHKGVEGFAGFISLRVYGIRYTKFFDDFKSQHMQDDRVSFSKLHD